MPEAELQLNEDQLLQYRKDNGFWRRFKRNKVAIFALALLVTILVAVIFAGYLTPYDNYQLDLNATFLFPGEQGHILGTDDVGRDLLTRILHGGRVSLTVALSSLLLGMSLGTLLGTAAGYMGKVSDNLIMRLMDGLAAFPTILLSLLLMTVLGPGIANLVIAMAVGNIPKFARLSRSLVCTEAQQDYILAERSLGASRGRIMFQHIWPNIFPTILAYGALHIGSAIIAEASLSFLGLGVAIPTASWGNILKSGKTVIETYPHISVFSGLAIVITAISFNLIGNGIRDALDKKLQ